MSAQYQLITNGEDLRRATNELSNKQAIGLDTETTELDPYLGRLRLVQLASADNVYIVDLNAFGAGDFSKSDALEPLRQLLAAPRPIKIAHNAKFHARFIRHELEVHP